MKNTNKKSFPKKGNGKPTGYKPGRPVKDTDPIKDNNIPDHNNWAFYAASEAIARDVASIPFNYLGGTPFRVKTNTVGASGSLPGELDEAIPSVLVLNHTESFSPGSGATNAINMASAQLYTKVRQMNSGAKNYDAPDLMMYVLAMKDMYAQFFEIKKILGFVGLYSTYNHNIPLTLFKAMNVDIEDARANQAIYRARLNELARKINSFKVPKYFKAFDRTAFINGLVFMDSESIRSQFYLFKRLGYYKWSGTASTTGTALIFTKYSDNQRTLNSLLEVLDNQIDAIFLDTDALTMSGDIDKAFPDSELYQIAETPDAYVTDVVHDADVLGQIENTVSVLNTGAGSSTLAYQLDVTQEDQQIKFRPLVKFAAANGPTIDVERAIFNSHKDNPDYRDVLEWSRLMTTTESSYEASTNRIQTIVTSCGLEIIWYMQIVYLRRASGKMQPDVEYIAQKKPGGVINYRLTHFDWHPFIYHTEVTNGNVFLPYGETKVATLIDADVIKRINDMASYGAFYATGFAEARK